MNLNGTQVIAIIIAVLSVLSGATSQLNDLFGAVVAKDLVSGAGLVTAILSSVLAVITSQGSQIKAVAAMPGVDRVVLNENASQAAAQVATDPQQPKVSGSSPDVQHTLQTIAKGA